MSEPLEIKVERGRASCPYCKGEVAGGHVWLCPGCAAPHHADCMNEHGACATCGARPAAAAAAQRPADDTRFGRFRAALGALGFAILRESEREVLALHPAWGGGQSHLVHLVAVDTLTRDQAEIDLARLFRDPLAQGNASLVHLAARVEPGALEWLHAAGSARSRSMFACVPMAATPTGVATPRGWLGGDAFPVHADLARRLIAQAASPLALPLQLGGLSAGRPRTPPAGGHTLKPDDLMLVLAMVVVAVVVMILFVLAVAR